MVSQGSEDAVQRPVVRVLQIWVEVQKIVNAYMFLLGRKQLTVYSPQLLDMPEWCGPYLDLTLLPSHKLSSVCYGDFTKHSPVCKPPENPLAGRVGSVCLQVPESRVESPSSKGSLACLHCTAMLSKQSCPPASVDQRVG